jgi:hypothetical protein
MTSIDDLPDEILLELFKLIPIKDVVHSVSLTCRRWREVALESALWRVYTQQKFPYQFKRDLPRIVQGGDGFLKYYQQVVSVSRRILHGIPNDSFTVPRRLEATTGRCFGVQVVDPFHHFGARNLGMHFMGAGEESGLRLWDENRDLVLNERFGTGLFDVYADYTTPGRFCASSFDGFAYLFELAPPGKNDDIEYMKPKELKELLHKNNFSSSDCFERSELVAKCRKLGLAKPKWRLKRIAECGQHVQPAVTARSYPSCLISSGFDGLIKLYDTSNVTSNTFSKLEAKWTFSLSRQNGPVPVNCFVYNQISGLLVSGSNDALLQVVDINQSKVANAGHLNHPGTVHNPVIKRSLTGHEHWIWSLTSWNAQDPQDLTTLVSGSVDRTIRVWDIRESKPCVGSISGFAGPIPGLQVTRDCIFAASFDGTIRVFDKRMVIGSNGHDRGLLNTFDSYHQNLARLSVGPSQGEPEYIAAACQHSDIHVLKFT